MSTFFSERRSRIFLWCLWGIWVLTVAGVQLWRLTHFNDTLFDLGIYSQTLWNATHGFGWWSSIQGHSYWSDHVEPFLWLFWPFMKFWWSPLWLLWGQTLVLASSIFPLYRLSRTALKSPWALAIPVLFLIHTTVWNTATIEFHVLPLAFPLVLWACVFLAEPQAKWWRFLLILIPLAMVREEMGLVVICFGILAAIKKKNWKWWLPPILIGAVWTGVAQWIQSFFISESRYTYYFPWVDLFQAGQWSAGVQTLMQSIFRWDSLRMLFEAFLAFGMVWVLAVEWLIPAVPVIGSFLVIHAGISNALVDGYHATVPTALVFACLPFGLAKLQRLLKKNRFSQTLFPIGLLISLVAVMQLTTWYAIWAPYPSRTNQLRPEEIAVLLQPIQPQDGVAASAQFLPLLANRQMLQSLWYIFRGQDEFYTTSYHLNPEVKWIVLDTNELVDQRTQKGEYFSLQKVFLETLNTQFQPVDKLGSVILYERKSPDRRLVLPALQEYQSGTLDDIPRLSPDQVAEFVVPGGEPTIVGNHLSVDFYLRQPNRWRQLEEQKKTPILKLVNGAQELTVPLGYAQISPDAMQEGDRVIMDIVLPERMLRSSQSNSELQIIGELVELQGLSYGRYASLVERTSWVETFLDKTVPLK